MLLLSTSLSRISLLKKYPSRVHVEGLTQVLHHPNSRQQSPLANLTLVPSRSHDGLGTWVVKQREQQYNSLVKGKDSFMTQNRVDLLNEIGFSWDPHKDQWIQWYKGLKAQVVVSILHCRPVRTVLTLFTLAATLPFWRDCVLQQDLVLLFGTASLGGD